MPSALIHYTSVVTHSRSKVRHLVVTVESKVCNTTTQFGAKHIAWPASNWATYIGPTSAEGSFRKRRQAGHIITECAATKWRCRRRKIISCSITRSARKRRDAKIREPRFPANDANFHINAAALCPAASACALARVCVKFNWSWKVIIPFNRNKRAGARAF